MTIQELYSLLDRFEASTLSRLKLQDGDFHLELSREAAPAAAGVPVVPSVPVAAAAAAPVPSAPAPSAPAPASGSEGQTSPKQPEASQGEILHSPVVGTFYSAPVPGGAPFVSAGQKVSKGSTLCLLEAMKTMNEVTASCDMKILEVLGQDGQLVEFGQPLFRYQAV